MTAVVRSSGVPADVAEPRQRDTSYARQHWGPYNPNGVECPFCSGSPRKQPHEDIQGFFACHDARFPPLYTKLRGILSELSR